MFLARVRHHPRYKILYNPSHFVLQQLEISASSIYITRVSARSM